jgi:hypothetical protein
MRRLFSALLFALIAATSTAQTSLSLFNRVQATPGAVAGDTYYTLNSDGKVVRRAIGSEGQCYMVVSGLPDWAACSGGGGSTSPLTTKGDIWGFSTVDARIPIGTTNQVLTVDPSQALGLKWAAPGSTSPLTTKGDLWAFSTTDVRFPAGTNGWILASDSTATEGLRWIQGLAFYEVSSTAADGVTTSFAFSDTVVSVVIVFVGGIAQNPSDISISGGNVVLGAGITPPPTGIKVAALYNTDIIGGSSGGGSGGYSTIQNEGVDLTQRTKLNFIGAGVTAADNSSTGVTDVTIPGGGGTWILDVQIFTADGTWTKPDSCTIVRVVGWAGGGGGGSGCAGCISGGGVGGTGGGGGEFKWQEFDCSTLGATEDVTIGAGGTGGATVTNPPDNAGIDGTDGEDSTFGLVYTVRGGKKGIKGSGGQAYSPGGAGGGWGDEQGGYGGGSGSPNPNGHGAHHAASGGGAGGWWTCCGFVVHNGWDGGGHDSSSGGGGTGGGVGGVGGSSGLAGTAGNAGVGTEGGYGGGGGGPTVGGSGLAAAGGGGGIPGGGGGGGGPVNSGGTSGQGAAGARGEIRVYVM